MGTRSVSGPLINRPGCGSSQTNTELLPQVFVITVTFETQRHRDIARQCRNQISRGAAEDEKPCRKKQDVTELLHKEDSHQFFESASSVSLCLNVSVTIIPKCSTTAPCRSRQLS